MIAQGDRPFIAPAGHGYASDLAALRAVIELYFAAQLDAALAHSVAYHRPGNGAAELRRYSDLRSATDSLVSVWCRCSTGDDLAKVLRGLGDHMPEPHAAWLRTVAEDVRARLSGDMTRPIPEPATPSPLAESVPPRGEP